MLRKRRRTSRTHLRRARSPRPSTPLYPCRVTNLSATNVDLASQRTGRRGLYARQQRRNPPQVKADEWALKQVYRRIVPEDPNSRGYGVRRCVRRFWIAWRFTATTCWSNAARWCWIQVAQGRNSHWLRALANSYRYRPVRYSPTAALLLGAIKRRSFRQPVYTNRATTKADWARSYGLMALGSPSPTALRWSRRCGAMGAFRCPRQSVSLKTYLIVAVRSAGRCRLDTPSLPPNSAAAAIQFPRRKQPFPAGVPAVMRKPIHAGTLACLAPSAEEQGLLQAQGICNALRQTAKRRQVCISRTIKDIEEVVSRISHNLYGQPHRRLI